jgi:hypothetical protein
MAAGNTERVQELTWALVDEQITADQMSLLDNLLLSDEQARATYIDCVRLHADLTAHFAAQPTPADTKPTATRTMSPVLGFLNAGMPPVGLPSPSIEDANS